MRSSSVVTTCLVATAALAACSGGGSSEPISTDGGGSSSSSSASSSSTSGSSGEGYPGPASSSSSSGAALPIPQTIVTATLSGAQCPDAGAVVMVGYFGQPTAGPPVPEQPAKGSWQGKSLTLQCTVKASGDGFAVTSSMYYDNASVGLNGLTPLGPDGFIAYVNVGASEYKHKNCTVDYPAGGGVAAGRFWAKIACAAEPGASCAINAEVRLENCAQE